MVIYRFSNVILWLSKVVLVSKVISWGVEFIDVTPILRNIQEREKHIPRQHQLSTSSNPSAFVNRVSNVEANNTLRHSRPQEEWTLGHFWR